MSEFKFDAATFEMVQSLVFPLVQTLVGFDAQGWVGDKSVMFTEVGEGLMDLSILFTLVGAALKDGKLTAEEISAIITQAATLPLAIEEITIAINGPKNPS